MGRSNANDLEDYRDDGVVAHRQNGGDFLGPSLPVVASTLRAYDFNFASPRRLTSGAFFLAAIASEARIRGIFEGCLLYLVYLNKRGLQLQELETKDLVEPGNTAIDA